MVRNRPIDDRRQVKVLSFRKVDLENGELARAQGDTGKELFGPVYRFEIFALSNASVIRQSGDHRVVRRRIPETTTLFIGSQQWVLKRDKQGDGTVRIGPWMFEDV